MKRILGLVYLALTASLANASVVIADWTFEGPINSNGNNYTYGVADIGTTASSASGHHASISTGWSFSAGSGGSPQSLDADHWAVNDYFQFAVSTAGYTQISVMFDQISSTTGPGKFLFEYSTDGSTFTPLGSDYVITHTEFTVSSTTMTENLTSISGLNDNSAVVFRLVDDSAISEKGGTVASGGASHVDNFIISGISVVPEPAEWGLISAVGLLGICGLREWRQRRRKVPPLVRLSTFRPPIFPSVHRG